jgi:hypothetical protein
MGPGGRLRARSAHAIVDTLGLYVSVAALAAGDFAVLLPECGVEGPRITSESASTSSIEIGV